MRTCLAAAKHSASPLSQSIQHVRKEKTSAGEKEGKNKGIVCVYPAIIEIILC